MKNIYNLTKIQIEEMRESLQEQFADLENASNEKIVQLIEKHYKGGIDHFIIDPKHSASSIKVIIQE